MRAQLLEQRGPVGVDVNSYVDDRSMNRLAMAVNIWAKIGHVLLAMVTPALRTITATTQGLEAGRIVIGHQPRAQIRISQGVILPVLFTAAVDVIHGEVFGCPAADTLLAVVPIDSFLGCPILDASAALAEDEPCSSG